MYRFVAAQKADHSVKTLCRVLGVSRSGFHAWERRPPSDRDLADAWLGERIRQIHSSSRVTYGAPRVHAELRFDGLRVGRKRVERLMCERQLSGLVWRRRGRTTIRVPGVRVANDLVGRDFQPAAPNRLWVADISYIRTWEGWLSVGTETLQDASLPFLAATASILLLAEIVRLQEGMFMHSDSNYRALIMKSPVPRNCKELRYPCAEECKSWMPAKRRWSEQLGRALQSLMARGQPAGSTSVWSG